MFTMNKCSTICCDRINLLLILSLYQDLILSPGLSWIESYWSTWHKLHLEVSCKSHERFQKFLELTFSHDFVTLGGVKEEISNPERFDFLLFNRDRRAKSFVPWSSIFAWKLFGNLIGWQFLFSPLWIGNFLDSDRTCVKKTEIKRFNCEKIYKR